ncbi:MAG TPA: hypothetical protein DIW48_13975 [Sphaerochaeta sp.]|nr:hypothetical protein [Sphaerochaeta sp.]
MLGICGYSTSAGFQQCTYTNHSIQDEQLLKTLSDTFGLPWRSVEQFEFDALVSAVERVVIKPDGIDVVMKYRKVANG